MALLEFAGLKPSGARRCGLLALPCVALLAAGAARADDGAVFAAVRAPAGTRLSALAAVTPMRIVLSLPLRDQAGAERYAAAVSDPDNALYGQYLTPAQFGARFGADPAAYALLRGWAQANGLDAGARTDSRSTLSVGGTAGQFAKLFGTRFAGFQTALHGDGYVTLNTPRLPAALVGRVDGVIGLSSAAHYAPLARIKPSGGPRADVGTGLGGGYSPADVRAAYNIPAQQSAAKTEVVGLFEQGGFKTSDITKYESQYGLPAVTLTPRSVNGASTGPNIGIELEADLDIDAVLGMNPAVPQIIIYEDGKDSFSVALIDSFALMAQDNTAKTISVSYGLDEIQQGTPAIRAEGRSLIQLAAQGQTVFISSGDDGAAGRSGSGLNAPDPGSQPLVTSVGGTTLNTVPASQKFLSETVWNDLSSGNGATGGGVSAVWSIPAYQLRNGVSVGVANGGSATKRNVPDIAAVADPFTAYSVYCALYGGWLSVGGTSLASPVWAGMTTIINSDRVAAGLPRLGFFNPLLYKLGAAGIGFHDTTIGHNGRPGYAAGAGYDNSTGFGSIDLTAFLPSVLAKPGQ